MTLKQQVVISLAILLFGVGIGYYTKPTKIETRMVEVVKESQTKQEAKDKVVYKEKIVYKDGTVKEIEKTEDKTRLNETSTKEATKEATQVVKNDIGLNLSVLAIRPISSLTSNTEYALHVDKRVISNITVGVFGSTDKKVGVSVGVSF